MQIAIQIKPGTKHREEVVENADGSLTIFTKAQAVEGRANEAAVHLLADHYGVNKSKVKLVRGHTSRRKVLKSASRQPSFWVLAELLY